MASCHSITWSGSLSSFRQANVSLNVTNLLTKKCCLNCHLWKQNDFLYVCSIHLFFSIFCIINHFLIILNPSFPSTIKMGFCINTDITGVTTMLLSLIFLVMLVVWQARFTLISWWSGERDVFTFENSSIQLVWYFSMPFSWGDSFKTNSQQSYVQYVQHLRW